MRFKKGSMVEVQNMEEPSCSWCHAEIVSGNGHTYHVKYIKSLTDMTLTTEKVPRKSIRPCPPQVQGPRSWAPHDIAEVFENNSWKLAEVIRIVDGNYYFVKLLGSSCEIIVHQSGLRVRQSWEDNRWMVIGKASRPCDNEVPSKAGSCLKFRFKVPWTCAKMPYCACDKYLPTEPNVILEEPHKICSRGKKRRLQFGAPTDEFVSGAILKPDETQNEVRCKRPSAGKLVQSAEKVDAVAFPPNQPGEKYLHASFKYRTTGFPKTMEYQEPNADIRCTFAREPSAPQSSTCSVGSSSGSNSIFSRHPVTNPNLDVDNNPDDAESISGPEKTIHKYELDSYLLTLKAFYASGPISWEQEALLSDLRHYHNISNDEYRAMLKGLMSSQL